LRADSVAALTARVWQPGAPGAASLPWLARTCSMLHTIGMTMPDLGPERPGHPSDTRQMVERGRTESGAQVSNPAFLIALAVIVVVVVVLFLLLR
jgi:hypothetical protein